MRMMVLGIVVAVIIELLLRAMKHQLRGVPFSPLTFAGAICFLAAIANYINQPVITYLLLYVCSFWAASRAVHR